MPRRSRYPLPNPLFSEPVFSEGGNMLPDPSNLLLPHPSDTATYTAIQKLLSEDTVPFEKSRIADDQLFKFEDALGSRGKDFIKLLENNGQIVFHCLGDSGASQAGKKYHDELTVMDAISQDCRVGDVKARPAFLYHLGDLVYNFGESKYYYDQFYDPLRNYPLPVFAIPGNHDSFIVPGTDQGEEPLAIFSRNFCATQTRVTVEARSLHRTAMTQPGVYFTLDAPYVRIIGLFSNSLEDPGLISSEGGNWPNVPDFQLSFLTSQLKKIRDEHYSGAIILALHHPPFSYKPTNQGNSRSSNHGSNLTMLKEIDTICKEIGIYPHAVLSGHAHNYQRFTRKINFTDATEDYEVPFIVCGNGGHNVTPLVYNDFHHNKDPKPGDVSYLDTNSIVNSKGLNLDNFDDYNYGYLKITVDQKHLKIHFNPTSTLGHQGPDDVVVDLGSHKIIK